MHPEDILEPLIHSQRYKDVVDELAVAVQETVNAIPFCEPQLAAFISDEDASTLLTRMIDKNTILMKELTDFFHEILEDTLLSEREFIPLEAKRDELWNSFTKSSFSKLIERYEQSSREEAALVVKYRNEKANNIRRTLQESVYDTETTNKRLKKEIKSLGMQLKEILSALDLENQQELPNIEEIEEAVGSVRKDKAKLEKLNKQIESTENQKEDLYKECCALQDEIEKMTEILARRKRGAHPKPPSKR